MARYINQINISAMFNRFYHMAENEHDKTLILDMKQAFLELPTTDEKSKVAEKIFEGIENILSDNWHTNCQMGDCIEDYYDDDIRDEIAEFKKQYMDVRECPDCKYFVGCETACGGVPCDLYDEGDEK